MQRISDHVIEDLREAANDNIELVLSELGVDIDRFHGFSDEFRCACPIHGGDNTTAFSYNTTFKSWRCYTKQCHKDNGSIFGLIRLLLAKESGKEVGFRDAVFWLAKLLNINVEQENVYEINPDDTEVRTLNKEAKFKKKLQRRITPKHTSEVFKPFEVSRLANKIVPSEYFIQQGFSKEILQKYNVGYCDDKSKPMYLRHYAPVLNDDGTLVIGVTGRIKYEKCDFCPLYHEQGKGCPHENKNVKGYPKWFHYGFNSGSVLYNSWFAKDYIKQSGIVIITEGPKDVWWLEQNDIHNSLAILGLNVTDVHLNQLIQMGVTTMIVALDKDEGGLTAMENIEEILGPYFKIINMKEMLNDGEDIADISIERMNNIVIPYLKRLEKNAG